MTPNSLQPCYLAGRAVTSTRTLPVHDKFSGREAAHVALAGPGEIERAIAAAVSAERACRTMPAHARAAVLRRISETLHARADDFARTLVTEVGKTIRDARAEVARAVETFRNGAEEATRITGEYLPLDTSARSENVEGIVRRFPVGACSFITPFNFPLNLAAHKIAPAVAAGCPFILKPSEKTPLTSLMLADILARTDWPADAWSILVVDLADVGPLVSDDRLKLLSFTGSSDVGWKLKAAAGRKKVTLELGGVAPCIIDESADLDRAVQRLVVGKFTTSGQSCIAVQRILVHESVYARLRDALVAAASRLTFGDPAREDTSVGPLISEDAARRVESWVKSAAHAGARILCGGTRDRSLIAPTILENVPSSGPGCELVCREVFGPVAVLERFTSFDDALARANSTPFGLQAGIFTSDLRRAFRAFHELDFGGVIINDVPTFRVDSMPYGGVKQSGFGREGLRYAIQDMTEPRIMVLSNVANP